MISHFISSKFMNYLYPSEATATHCIRVKTTMVWKTLWIGLNAAMAIALFSAFTNPWTIAAAWAAAATFAFYSAPCAISAAWTAADVFAFCAMILYWSRLKHVSYCYHLVTSIWLVFKWVRWNLYLESCQLHWVISPCFSIPTQCGAPTCDL